MGILGICFALAAAYALSSNRSRVGVRIIAWGIGLQLLVAVLALRTPLGQAMAVLAEWFNHFVLLAEEGGALVFGDLGRSEHGVVFAFQVLPLIIVVSGLSAVLYHWGIMQRIVDLLAVVMLRGMRASGAESLTVAANLFLGQGAAPLTVRPYLDKLTRSELMTVMTSGMATVAGAILFAYVQMGGAKAENLLTALLMTVPTCIMMAKIFEPETGKPETLGHVPPQSSEQHRNVIDAATHGASEGLRISLQVAAMLIAFVGLIAIVNGLLNAIQGSIGWSWFPASIEDILGPVFAPIAWMIGIEWADAAAVGNLLGTRIVLNEFVSYSELASIKDTLQPKSFMIANYALCGFANVGSIGIQIGALGAILPDRRAELAALGFRAMIAATLANFMTASTAGLIAFTPLLDY